jgi:hypothetical protein
MIKKKMYKSVEEIEIDSIDELKKALEFVGGGQPEGQNCTVIIHQSASEEVVQKIIDQFDKEAEETLNKLHYGLSSCAYEFRGMEDFCQTDDSIKFMLRWNNG